MYAAVAHVHAVDNGITYRPTALDDSPAHDRYVVRLRRSTILQPASMVPPGRRLEKKRTGNSVVPTMKHHSENKPQEALAPSIGRGAWSSARPAEARRAVRGSRRERSRPSTSVRTIQSVPSRVTDVAPNVATRKRPTASGESELTRASSRSFMAVSSGKGQSNAFVMRLRPSRPVTARSGGYCFLLIILRGRPSRLVLWRALLPGWVAKW